MSLAGIIRNTRIGRAISRASLAFYAVSALSAGVLASQIGCWGDKEEGVVSGRVTDSQTNSPLAGARVSIDDLAATTGNDGRYSLKVPIGEQEINAEREEYTPYKATMYVSDGTNSHDITLVKLVQTYILTGRVVEPKNEPLGGVLIQVIRNADKTQNQTAETDKEPDVKKDTTDSSGNYQISHLAPGEYTLTATKDEYGEFSVGDVLIGNRDRNFNINMLWDNVLENRVIAKDTVFKAVASPYILRGNVLVSEGAVLTIEPGVTVKFEDRAELRVSSRAKLYAIGKENNPILFTSNNPLPQQGQWESIHIGGNLEVGIGSGFFEHCIVEYAKSGIYDFTYGMKIVSIKNSILRYCEDGVTTLSNTSIVNNMFYDNETGITILYRSPLIKNNLMFNNRTGIYIFNMGGAINSASPQIEYCTVVASGRGILDSSHDKENSPTVKNSIVVSERDPDWPVNIMDITYTIIWSPAGPNLPLPPGKGNLVANPLLNPVNGYRPMLGSPALTASDKGGEIGAYGNGGNPPSPNQ